MVVVVAFLGGLFLGRSGRSEIETARNHAELGVELHKARVEKTKEDAHAKVEELKSKLSGSTAGAAA